MRSVVALALGLLPAVAPQAKADTFWRGAAVVDDAVGTCSNYNPKGNVYTVRFAPARIGSNGNNSRLSWFENDGAKSFDLIEHAFDNKSRKVVYTSIYSGAGEDKSASVKFNKQNPGLLTESTKFIEVEAEMSNFDFMKGCTIYVKMSLVKATR